MGKKTLVIRGWSNPFIRAGMLSLVSAIGLAFTIWWFGYPLDGVQSWLIAISAVTFLTYGYDKVVAGSGRTRVPEKVMLAQVLVGGTLGGIAAMAFFRHKTSKERFQFKFWLAVLVQMAVITAVKLL